MWAYLLRRLVQAVLILLGVSFITFLLLYVYSGERKNLLWYIVPAAVTISLITVLVGVTGGVLLLAASVDAISRRRRSSTGLG